MATFEETFTTMTCSLHTLFILVLVTPINQRPFRWGFSQTDKFVHDAWDRFTAKLMYNIGSFIMYTFGGITYNYDGQSRLTTSLLLLHSVKKYVTEEERLEIDKTIFLERSFGTNKLTTEQVKIKETYKWKKFPRIQSYYTDDFVALGNCLNDLPYSHPYIVDCVKACHLFLEGIPNDKISDFIEFFLNNTQASKKDYKSPALAAKDMDIENNRGKQMTPFDNARNILITTNTCNQKEVSTLLDTLINIPKGLDMACLVYTNHITEPGKDYINEIVTGMTRKEETSIFINIIKDVVTMWESVNTSNAYKLLGIRYKEWVWNIGIPVSILNKLSPEESISFARKSLYYLVKSGVFSVNALAHRGPWVKSANKWISDKACTSLPELKIVTPEELITTIHNTQDLPSFVIKVYAEMLQSPAAPIVWDNVDIEHIIARSTKAAYVGKLGNLTVFERKKPQHIAGLHGNRSIKDRPYCEKKTAYALSSIVATRTVSNMYNETFGSLEVEERGRNIVQHILSMA